MDDYKPIIDQFCNATITDVNEMDRNVGRELAFACVTISGEERTTPDGKYQYGVLVVEDYTDKYEFRLRRKDFERFRHFLHPDYYLLIRGEVKSFVTYDKDDIHQLNPKTRTFFSISSMTQLNDVVDGIQQLMLYLDVDQISEDFVEELYEAAKVSKGKTIVQVMFYDSASGVSVNMHAKKIRIQFNDNIRKVLDKYQVKYTLS